MSPASVAAAASPSSVRTWPRRGPRPRASTARRPDRRRPEPQPTHRARSSSSPRAPRGAPGRRRPPAGLQRRVQRSQGRLGAASSPGDERAHLVGRRAAGSFQTALGFLEVAGVPRQPREGRLRRPARSGQASTRRRRRQDALRRWPLRPPYLSMRRARSGSGPPRLRLLVPRSARPTRARSDRRGSARTRGQFRQRRSGPSARQIALGQVDRRRIGHGAGELPHDADDALFRLRRLRPPPMRSHRRRRRARSSRVHDAGARSAARSAARDARSPSRAVIGPDGPARRARPDQPETSHRGSHARSSSARSNAFTSGEPSLRAHLLASFEPRARAGPPMAAETIAAGAHVPRSASAR